MIKKIRSIGLAIMMVVALITTPIINPLPVNGATTLDQIADRLSEVYPFLDPSDKDVIAQVRGNFNNENIMTPENWDKVIEPLLYKTNTTGQYLDQAGIVTTDPDKYVVNDKLTAKFGDDLAATKDALVAFAKGSGTVYYSTDYITLKDNLTTYRDQYKETFWEIFGNDMTLNDLYELEAKTRDAYRYVITPNIVMDLAYATNAELIEIMPDLTISAARYALANYSELAKLSGRLTDVGWSADSLELQRRALSNIVDPEHKVDVVFGKVAVRSQAKIYRNGLVLNGAHPMINDNFSLSQINTTQEYQLTIMGRDVTGMVDWLIVPTPTTPATIDMYTGVLTPKEAGAAHVIALRYNQDKTDIDEDGDILENTLSPVDDWISRFIVTVGTADEIAAGISGIADPTLSDTNLILPAVPTGFFLAITNSSQPSIITTSGAIAFPTTPTAVDLSLAVIRMSDGTTAPAGPFTVQVPAPVSDVPVSGITLNTTSASIAINGSVTLSAVIAPSDATDKRVEWSSSNTTVASVTVSGAVYGHTTGTAIITAKSLANPSLTATAEITVYKPAIPVTNVAMNKNSTTILAGQSETLTVTVEPSDADDTTVTWTSSDESVVTVVNGVVTAVAPGTATITATSNADVYKSASCVVTVASTKKQVQGYVSILGNLAGTGVTVSIKSGSTEVASGTTNTAGFFDVAVDEGTYTIELSRPGYLTRTLANVSINSAVVTLSLNTSPINLWAGDVNGDTRINLTDLTTLLASYNKVGSYPSIDFNGSNSINLTDLTGLLANYNKIASQYPTVVLP